MINTNLYRFTFQRCLASFKLIGLLFLISCSNEGEKYRSWRIYSGDASGSKYSNLTQINTQNVDQLKLIWELEIFDPSENHKDGIQCNPIVIDNQMYVIGPDLKVHAIQASSGIINWSFDPFPGEKYSGNSRGVTYFDDGKNGRIFFVAASDLYCLDARTGEPISGFGNQGKVSLKKGFGEEKSQLFITASTPGIIYENLLILGSRVLDGANQKTMPGNIRAFDVFSGKIEWEFKTIPSPGELGYDTWPKDAWKNEYISVNSWSGFTLDQENDLLFFGTGSPSYDHWGGNRIGDNLFGNCIMALNAKTGKRIWHFQTVHHDLWDYDIPCPPNLVRVNSNGKLVDAIAQPTKTGQLFVLNRHTGTPIHPVTEKAVPTSDIPGEITSKTQPFTTDGLIYATTTIDQNSLNKIEGFQNQSIQDSLVGMIYGQLYLPPSKQPTMVFPQFNGGTDWGGAAYDPRERMLYVNASNEPEWFAMMDLTENQVITSYQYGKQLFDAHCKICHNTSQNNLLTHLDKHDRPRIKAALVQGKGQMPAFPHFEASALNALSDYITDLDSGKKIKIENRDKAFEIPWVANGHPELKTKNGYPINQTPWGTLSKIDLDAGKIDWQIPLGTYPQLEKQGHPPTGTFNMGGPVVTAGNLIFIGATMDERFRAFDQSNGKMLWEYPLEAGGYATPAIYEVNGKQYIVIAGGGNGKPGTKGGNKLYCFGL
ncbi:MAG: pyrroloquinoline quinone-dependent dehydrogenase [Flavobacteriia bacterium]|nr:pyrroloquinoline quinone-dependent dehydrogenase [Flavobacteriia bacterium]